MIAALNIAAYVALALAAWAAFRGGPSAGALVLSNILCRAASLLGVRFDPGVWLAVDLAVIAFIVMGAIERSRLMRREMAILVLFPVIWPFYWLPADEGQFVAVSLAVIAQLLLTLPWRTIDYTAATWLGLAVGAKPDRLEMVNGAR